MRRDARFAGPGREIPQLPRSLLWKRHRSGSEMAVASEFRVRHLLSSRAGSTVVRNRAGG